MCTEYVLFNIPGFPNQAVYALEVYSLSALGIILKCKNFEKAKILNMNFAINESKCPNNELFKNSENIRYL